MPTTLTLKGIPEELYDRLKQTAELHRRSLNNEAIFVLETMLLPNQPSSADRIARARALRAAVGTTGFQASDIDRFKRAGRR